MPPSAKSRTAVIAGPTGLVGSQLLAGLLGVSLYRRVVALARRPLPAAAKLETVDADYLRLDRVLDGITAKDAPIDVFCCLGTTLARAGSREAFRRVDHDYVMALGRWAVAARARRLIVISAVGADAASRVFYNRVKGETERDLQSLGLASLVLVRPSLLEGSRGEFRLGEAIALAATRPVRRFLPAGVRPISAGDVAAAMIESAEMEKPPLVLESAAMQGAARRR